MYRNFSFYRFTSLERLYPVLRSTFLTAWTDLGVTGRVYLCAREGINGSVSVPRAHLDAFAQSLRPALGPQLPFFNDAVGLDHAERPFTSLHVRWRPTLGQEPLPPCRRVCVCVCVC